MPVLVPAQEFGLPRVHTHTRGSDEGKCRQKCKQHCSEDALTGVLHVIPSSRLALASHDLPIQVSQILERLLPGSQPNNPLAEAPPPFLLGVSKEYGPELLRQLPSLPRGVDVQPRTERASQPVRLRRRLAQRGPSVNWNRAYSNCQRYVYIAFWTGISGCDCGRLLAVLFRKILSSTSYANGGRQGTPGNTW